MATSRPSFVGRTSFALLAVAAVIPLACGGEAESAAAEASRRVEPAPVSDAPAEPVPPTMRSAPEPPVEAASERVPRPVVVAREPGSTPSLSAAPEHVVEATAPAEPAAPAELAYAPLFVPAGTLLETSIQAELSTEKSAAGDRFFATLAEDLLGEEVEAGEDPVRLFLDVLNHRLLSLLYRAWTKYRWAFTFEPVAWTTLPVPSASTVPITMLTSVMVRIDRWILFIGKLPPKLVSSGLLASR